MVKHIDFTRKMCELIETVTQLVKQKYYVWEMNWHLLEEKRRTHHENSQR